MGMFDEVFYRCPGCGKQIIEQSKAGNCSLNGYSSDQVPVEIAKDLHGQTIQCEACGNYYKQFAVTPVENVRMILID